MGKKFVINYGVRMLFPFYIFLFSAFLVCFSLASSVEVQERGTERGCERTKLRHSSHPTKGNTVTVETETTAVSSRLFFHSVEEGWEARPGWRPPTDCCEKPGVPRLLSGFSSVGSLERHNQCSFHLLCLEVRQKSGLLFKTDKYVQSLNRSSSQPHTSQHTVRPCGMTVSC